MMAKPVGPVRLYVLFLCVLSSDDSENELSRCTKGGSNAFFLLNYFKESKDLQLSITPLCWKHQGFGIFPRHWALVPFTLSLWVRESEVKWALSQEKDPPHGGLGFSPENTLQTENDSLTVSSER